MGKSYKHTPYCCDKKGKEKKRIANKSVRNYLKNVDYAPAPSTFKKVYDSWEICDYKWYGSDFELFYQKEVEDWKRWRYRYYPFPTREEAWRFYLKWYLRK